MGKSKEVFEGIFEGMEGEVVYNPEIIQNKKSETFNIEKQEGLSKQEISIKKEATPIINERDELSKIYAQIVVKELTPELVKESKDLRLKLVKIRTGIAEIHKSQKDFFLQGGRFVDSWKNKETASVVLMEDRLKQIENHYINLEKKRIQSLQNERIALVSPYMDVENVVLSDMEDDVFQAYLTAKKKSFKLQESMAKEAEELRLKIIADKEAEDKRIRKENEALKKEADRLKKIQAEKDAKVQKELEEKEAEAKAEKQKLETEQKAIQDKLNLEIQKKEDELKRIQDEAEKKRLKDIAEKEAEAKAEKEALQLELSKGDESKMKDLISDLTALKTKYSFKSDVNKKKYSNVSELLGKVIKHIE